MYYWRVDWTEEGEELFFMLLIFWMKRIIITKNIEYLSFRRVLISLL
jgi:hypothetical protein